MFNLTLRQIGSILKYLLVIIGLTIAQPLRMSGQIIFGPTGDSVTSVISNMFREKVNILKNIDVTSKRMTTVDILDSVIAHSIHNYPKHKAYKLNIGISLYNSIDTIFNCISKVYLIRPVEKMRQYIIVMPKENSHLISVNKLIGKQSTRLMEVDGFPKILIEDYLADIKRQVINNDSYFARLFYSNDSDINILIKFNKLPNSILVRRDIDANYPEAVFFRILNINRETWAITSSYTIVSEVTTELYNKFINSNNYFQLYNTAINVLKNNHLKHFSSLVRFKNDDSSYQLSDFVFENNLYLVSRKLFIKSENLEKSLYCYWMHDFIPIDKKVDIPTKQFNISEVLKN